MAVLVGFIGKGRMEKGGQGYETTTYRFSGDDGEPAGEYRTSIFGEALRRHLCAMNRPPHRWLIMGTAESMWDGLLDIVPEDRWDDALDKVSSDVGKAIREKDLTQAHLDAWEAALTSRIADTEVRCRLVGPADTPESQALVWGALYDAIGKKDDVVIDVTHGLRHQPVLMSFMVPLLRWLRDLRSIEIYYGALDLRQSKEAAPALKLSMCEQLLRTIEAVATYEYSGKYERLGDVALLSEESKELLRKVAFLDEINRQPRREAARLTTELAATAGDVAPIARSVASLLEEPLDWVNQETLAERLLHKASAAFRHGQYLRAIVLLWEGLLVSGCRWLKIEDPDTYKARERSSEKLNSTLKGEAWLAFDNLRKLRNAVVHGTEDRDKDVERALIDVKDFTKIFRNGERLARDLLRRDGEQEAVASGDDTRG